MSVCSSWISVWHIAYNTCVYMHVCWRVEWATSLSAKCNIFFNKQYVKRRVDESKDLYLIKVTHSPLWGFVFYISNEFDVFLILAYLSFLPNKTFLVWLPSIFSVLPSVNILHLLNNFLEIDVKAYNV